MIEYPNKEIGDALLYPYQNAIKHYTLMAMVHDSNLDPLWKKEKEDHKPAKFPKKRGGMDLKSFRECVNKGKQ